MIDVLTGFHFVFRVIYIIANDALYKNAIPEYNSFEVVVHVHWETPYIVADVEKVLLYFLFPNMQTTSWCGGSSVLLMVQKLLVLR